MIKGFIVNSLISVLRKLNCSVIIGFEINGDIQAKSGYVRMYNNNHVGKFYMSDGREFEIPNCKFSYKEKAKKEKRK